MSRAKQGDRVKIHYTKKLESGRIIDTSKEGRGLEITIGREIVPLFERGVEGMKVGEKRTIKVPPEKAHGRRLNELILNVSKTRLPKRLSPVPGKKVTLRGPDGNPINARITEIREDTVTIDANHPLAGKSLLFEFELLEIQ